MKGQIIKGDFSKRSKDLCQLKLAEERQRQIQGQRLEQRIARCLEFSQNRRSVNENSN